MWRFKGDDLAAAQARVEAALAIGIDLFDTADIYGPDNGEPFGAAEALLGRVFTGSPGLRDRLVLATKGGIEMGVPYNASATYLERACEASLRRLGVERIDLYQIHRPDILAHPAEVAGALDRLRTAGKIAEAGLSNHTPAQVAALAAHLPFPLASVQPELSPLAIGPIFDGVLDQAMQLGLGVLGWSPLAGGRIAAPGENVRAREVAHALDRLAQAHGVGRIAEAAQALAVTLTRTEWYEVLVAARGEPLP